MSCNLTKYFVPASQRLTDYNGENVKDRMKHCCDMYNVDKSVHKVMPYTMVSKPLCSKV